MKLRIMFVAACAVVAAGCTTASGPTYNTDVVKLSNGEQAYRVQCQGILESGKACVEHAKEICQAKPVHTISSIDRAIIGYKPENDPREITFTCGEPVVEQSVAQVVPVIPAKAPESAPIRNFTLQSDANFAINSATLTPAAKIRLDEFIAAVHGHEIESLSIAGHTDATGSVGLNNRLSLARARSVQAYLSSQGLKTDRYDVQGFGSRMPVGSNATVAGRAKNRRVEIQIDGMQ